MTKDQMKSIEREYELAEYAAQIHGLVARLAAVSNPKRGFNKAVERAKKRVHFL
ncbi:hypothetical protein [Pararhizobium sp. IMCC21322]|uniref:hypothetical protein n=1 Tax=Pararhizobium sp. IMCC21322 TaxID=3067903 RepID=UPI00274086DD|nr:hypothetical protein [Pararhizobium sp. IMCC21322]